MGNEGRITKIGNILVEQGVIKQDQLDDSLKIQKNNGKKLGEILVERGFITDQKLTEALAETFQLPVVNLSQISIDEKVLDLFSFDTLHKLRVIPIEIKDEYLLVATNNPLDLSALEEVRYISGYPVQPMMTSREDVERFLREKLESWRTRQAIRDAQGRDKSSTKFNPNEEIQEAPIIKLVNSVLTRAVKEKASDVHFEPQKDHLRVRFRIDGVLYNKLTIPQELQKKVISRIKIISGMDVAESRKPQDGRMSFSEAKGEYDVRLSTLPDLAGESVALRILNKNYVHHSFSDLGLDKDQSKVLQQLIARPYGMILICGPTGAGKTTTLYSILNSINDISRNIITVEDPIEYELPGINQTAINNQARYSFATAIRHILRHDPDVIMVGEIRDIETAQIAIRAALTGHLVLSTIHANNTAGAITRLLDMDIEPFLINSAVIGVVAQRLVRRLCPVCQKEYPLTPELAQEFSGLIKKEEKLTFAEPSGCPQCLQTGYSGRIGIFETLKIDDQIRHQILKHATTDEILNQAASKGLKTLRVAGFNLARQKITSLSEVGRVTLIEE